MDINEPLPQLGSGAAFRLNLMGNDNKVADRDVAEYRRYGFAPSLAFGLGTSTRVVFSYFHQSEDDTPDYGIPWLFNGPAPVARNNYYGFQDANFLRTNDDIFTAKVGARPRRTASRCATLSVTLMKPATRKSPKPQIPICRHRRLPAARLSTPLSAIQINRNQINVDSVETMLDDQMDATFRFHTGFIKHTLVTGLEAIARNFRSHPQYHHRRAHH